MSPHRLRNVRRQRLLDLIDEPTLAPITLITAPAGYGKTTIAQQWIAHHPGYASGWYQVRTEHNLLETFLTHLWATIDAATGQSDPFPAEISASSLRDRLLRAAVPIALVIDDFHLIQNTSIDQVMGTLLRELPDGTHFFILSRHIPALSLARMRAYGKVLSIGPDHLSFTLDEVREIFAGIGANDELVRQLTERSEGWIAGLQLVMMSVNAHGDLTSAKLTRALESMSENRLLSEYIMEEVLAALPDDLRAFVFDTVYLDRLDPDLCAAVLPIDSSAALLERLEGASAFVGRSNEAEQHLTYHRLFAECVQRLHARSSAEPTGQELRLRASGWYRALGKLEEATEYALAAEAWDLAAELMGEFVLGNWTHVNVWDTHFWLGRLPEASLWDHPDLLERYVESTFAIGCIDATRPLVDRYLTMLGGELDSRQRGWHAKVRALTATLDGDRDNALYYSYQALSWLPLDEPTERLLVWAIVHMEACYRGDLTLARAAYQQGAIINDARQRESVHWQFMFGLDHANSVAIQGDLNGAKSLLYRQLEEMPPHFRTSLGHHELRLLIIALEQDQLDVAAAHVEAIEADLQRRGYAPWFGESQVALAHYFILTGDPERARRTLEHALKVTRRHGGAEFTRKVAAGLADCWLRAGQDALARQWAESIELTPYLSGRLGDIEPRAVLAELMLRQGRWQETQALLADSIELARHRSHRAAEIKFLTLSSVAARMAGDAEAADDGLRVALELGTPGQFTRVFKDAHCDLSDAIRALIPSLSEPAQAHAQWLAGDCAPDLLSPRAGIDLTQREREVLTELLLGKSNREIGESLYITERTVKKHLASLFRKTGSTSRMALALWAREHLPPPELASLRQSPADVGSLRFHKHG